MKDFTSDGRGPDIGGGGGGGSSRGGIAATPGVKSMTKKERRFYQATQLLDQLLAGYDRRLRPGFRGQFCQLITMVTMVPNSWPTFVSQYSRL